VGVNQTLKQKILRRDKWRCRFCGRPGGELTIDHIVPRARGGHQYKKANLVAACRRCNQYKANKTPDECGMPILTEFFDETLDETIVWEYTPPGRLSPNHDRATELIVVRPSRRKRKRTDRTTRKAVLKKLGY
jgi:hypothetical protein